MLLPVLALVVQFDRFQVLQPYEVRSAGGEWSARVDPSARSGAGPSNVRVEHAGKLAWQAELPFTLFEAQLSDTGHLGGYGFTHGFPPMFPKGDFVVAIFDPAGKQLLDEREPMEASRAIHGTPDPNPMGVFLGDAGREFVVRIFNPDSFNGSEAWWRYELATGEARPSLNPRSKLGTLMGTAYVKDVRAIPSTPLSLVEWFCLPHQGIRFAALDPEGEVAWELDLPMEQKPQSGVPWAEALERLRRTSGVLSLPAPRQFELQHVFEKQRVTYEVVAGSGEKPWEVREVARAPWRLELTAASGPETETLLWKDVVTVPLEIERVVASELTSIVALAPSADGTVRFVQERGPGPMELVTLDAKGAVTALVEVVETPDAVCGQHWLWVGDGSWLVVADGNDERSAKAWFVEHRTGAVSEVLEFPDWRDLTLARRPDGGFVVLSSFYEANHVGVFDAEGELQPGTWNPELEDVHGDSIAVGQDSSVYVLGRTGDEVACFDLEGNLKRKFLIPTTGVDPEEEHHYYTRILAEPAGTLLVYDFDSDEGSEWLRLDVEGKLLGRFSVHRADGNVDVDCCDLVAQDEAGALWGAFDAEIFTIDATGVTTTRYGAREDGPRLEDPEVPRFDAFRRPVIRDRRTRDAFVFRPDGKLERRVATPKAELGSVTSFEMHFVSGPEERYLVQPDDYHDKWLELDAKDKFLGRRELGGELALWLPDGDFWVAQIGRHEDCDVSRVTSDGQRPVRIARQPDGRFFDAIDVIGPGPDGGVSVVVGQGRKRAILLYDSQGRSKASLPIPFDNRSSHLKAVCWAGEWAIAAGFGGTATVVHVATGKCFRVEVPSEGDVFGWTLSPDGSEVWCAGVNPPALMKLALPKL
ncbi:MAG: hypothetical protein HUU28_10470 [Planctomycetaceae bacterium]|nr:hypothetical protein [Planctomycetaceae bacterium]